MPYSPETTRRAYAVAVAPDWHAPAGRPHAEAGLVSCVTFARERLSALPPRGVAARVGRRLRQGEGKERTKRSVAQTLETDLPGGGVRRCAESSKIVVSNEGTLRPTIRSKRWRGPVHERARFDNPCLGALTVERPQHAWFADNDQSLLAALDVSLIAPCMGAVTVDSPEKPARGPIDVPRHVGACNLHYAAACLWRTSASVHSAPSSPESMIDSLTRWADRSLSVEARVLFSHARVASAAAGLDRTRSLDWRRLLALSMREGANPVFARRVLEEQQQSLPPDARTAFTELVQVSELRQRYLQRRFLDLIARLDDAAIPVVLLKGAAMACTTHRSFARRPMSDIDLLVEPHRVREALTIALLDGWDRRFAPRFDGLYGTMHHLPPLIDRRAPAMAVKLELHTDIVPPVSNPFAFTAAHVREEAMAVRDLSEWISVPRLEHRLLHCCIHFGWSHQFQKGSWKAFLDVAAMAGDDELDWDRFLVLAERSRAASCCYWTLYLAHVLSHADIPRHVLNRLQPSLPAVLTRALERHLAGNLIAVEGLCPSSRMAAAAWWLASQPDRDEFGHHPRWRPVDGDWRDLVNSEAPEALIDARRSSVRTRAWWRYVNALLTPVSAS